MVELMKLVEKEKIELREVELWNKGIDGLTGLYLDNLILLCTSIKTLAQKRCILAEELGHHFTAFGNIIDQSKLVNVKQENKGRQWAYEHLISFRKLITASKSGIRNHYELAEFLCVTESFLSDAISHYRSKYGAYHRIDRYILYFEPLGVMELLEEL